MKKVYAASLALAVAMAANAAPIEKSVKLETQPMTMSQANLDAVITPSAEKPATAATPKAINSIDDLVGLKTWSCVGHLRGEGKSGPRQQACYFSKSDATTLLMENFPWAGKETKMLVNINAKTVTIMNKQAVGENGTGGDMVYLYLYEANETAEGVDLVSKPSVKGTIQDDGTISFPANVYFGASDPANEPDGSYYYLDSDNVFAALPYNTPAEADYESVGTGTFNDGWFNSLLILNDVAPVEGTEVEVLRNKTNRNLIALKKPYANPEWTARLGGSVLTDNGYILLNISDPTWVQVVPLVECDMATEEEDGSLCNYYPYNEEGYYVWQGIDYSSIKEEWELFEVPISNIDENALVSLYHLYFGVTGAPADPYWWTGWPEDEVKSATVQLPKGTLGIEGVATDMVEGPVKYYNLQGVELAAPVKGQLTIKKQGGNSVKFIAR